MIVMRACLLILSLVLLAGCGSPPPAPREEPVPAAVEAARLRALDPPAASEVRDLRAQEVAAETAAAQASAAGKPEQADSQRQLGEALGRLRAAADVREREQRRQLADLASEADRRAVLEQTELDRRAAAAQTAADVRHAAAQRESDRRWAGWGLGLAVAAGVALHLLGLPTLMSSGIPAAVGAGCLTLAAWSAVPWLATVLGVVLASGLVIALAVLARHLVAEWTDYAQRLGGIYPNGKAEADIASRARQPTWVRWTLDHLLAVHAASTNAAAAATATAAATVTDLVTAGRAALAHGDSSTSDTPGR